MSTADETAGSRSDSSGEGDAPPSERDSDVAGRLRALRARLELSQEQFARLLGVSFASVNRWERGRNEPRSSVLDRLTALERDGVPADLPLEGATESEAELSAAAPRRPTIPVPSSTFIGRSEEIGRLLGLSASTRLLSLVGPAGCGKTRLAAELVRRLDDPDRLIAFVDLALVSSTNLVAAEVASVLGLRDSRGVGPTEQLGEALQNERGIIVLDNCEHVRGAIAPLVAYLLERAPELRIVTTSREFLGLAGETVHAVPPLAVPRPDASPAQIEHSDAVMLFCTRARERSPAFIADQEGLQAIAGLARLVDGLPLAIELAAAWVGTLTPDEIAARLDDRFAVLVAAAGDEGRHKTLRAAIEWSDDRLAAADRFVLSRVSIMRGAWTISDAAAATAIGPEDLLLSLRRLVESSWIVPVPPPRSNDPTRYRMLETLRAYGYELLKKSGELEDTSARFTSYLADRADELTPLLAGSAQASAIDLLDSLREDFVIGLTWAESRGEFELGLRLVGGLWNWWMTKGRVGEGRRWCDAFLAKTPALDGSPVRARALYASAVFAAEQGDYAASGASATAARELFVALADDGGNGDACRMLAIVARFTGDLDRAETLLEEALTSYRLVEDERGIATALNNLAALALDIGDLARARTLLDESLSLKRRLGDRRSLAHGLINFADLLVRVGVPSQALAPLTEARAIADELHDVRVGAFAEHNLGDAQLALGDARSAAHHYREALALFEEGDAARDVTLALCSLGRALSASGDRTGAVDALRRSESLASSLGDAQRVAEARAALDACGETPVKTALPGGLTGREADVIGLLAAGLSNREIAARLVVSVPTVERHVANIYAKLAVRSRVEATRYAVRHGLARTLDQS